MNKEKQTAALDALRSLQTLNYKEREITLGGVKIVLAPLRVDEVIEVFEISGKYTDEDAAVQRMKLEVIARSIIKVDDIVLDPEGMIEEKIRIVSSFGDEVIDVLFDEYDKLDVSIKKTINKRTYDKIEKAIDEIPEN